MVSIMGSIQLKPQHTNTTPWTQFVSYIEKIGVQAGTCTTRKVTRVVTDVDIASFSSSRSWYPPLSSGLHLGLQDRCDLIQQLPFPHRHLRRGKGKHVAARAVVKSASIRCCQLDTSFGSTQVP